MRLTRYCIYDDQGREGVPMVEPDGDWMKADDVRALLAHDAALRQEIAQLTAELHETWQDECGVVWRRPSAWAYAQTCKALHQVKQERDRLKAALEDVIWPYEHREGYTGDELVERPYEIAKQALSPKESA